MGDKIKLFNQLSFAEKYSADMSESTNCDYIVITFNDIVYNDIYYLVLTEEWYGGYRWGDDKIRLFINNMDATNYAEDIGQKYNLETMVLKIKNGN